MDIGTSKIRGGEEGLRLGNGPVEEREGVSRESLVGVADPAGETCSEGSDSFGFIAA